MNQVITMNKKTLTTIQIVLAVIVLVVCGFLWIRKITTIDV